MNHYVPWKLENFFTNWVTISLSKRTVFHGVNNELTIQNIIALSLNDILFLQGGNSWLETIGQCVSIAHLQLGWDNSPRTEYNSCFWKREWLLNKVRNMRNFTVVELIVWIVYNYIFNSFGNYWFCLLFVRIWQLFSEVCYCV